MLKDLDILNYRGFRRFSLNTLGQVNLVVGPNNSGKSSFLEAVYLFASEGTLEAILNVLYQRREFVYDLDSFLHDTNLSGGYQIQYMFTRHGNNEIIIQSEADQDKNICFNLGESNDLSVIKSASRELSKLNIEGVAYSILSVTYSPPDFDPNLDNNILRGFPVLNGKILPYSPQLNHYSILNVLSTEQPAILITASVFQPTTLNYLWADITLTPKEDKIIQALQLIEPDIERISLAGQGASNSGFLIKLKNEDKPVPLETMGDGVQRILTIMAYLVSVKDGTLLIDEIDTGLYYETLIDMWQLILKTAIKENVQVFATTHSWDCVKAFQQALTDVEQENLGVLVRLETDNGDIKPVTYTKDELTTAIQHNIEVR